MIEDDDEDDWAPLTADQLVQRPGEEVAIEALWGPPAPPASPPTAEPVPEAVVVAPLDPAAARALRALQERMTYAPSSKSLIAQVQHREQRDARKQRSAAMANDQLSAIVVGAVEATAQSERGEADDPDGDVDVRETESWFLALPEAEQQRLRATWHQERHRFDDLGKQRRHRLGRAVAYGAGCFLVLGLGHAVFIGSLALVLPVLVAGTVAAAIAEAIGGGRFIYSMLGALAFVIVVGPTILVQPFGLCTVLLATYGMGLVGMDGEMRRSGGFGSTK